MLDERNGRLQWKTTGNYFVGYTIGKSTVWSRHVATSERPLKGWETNRSHSGKSQQLKVLDVSEQEDPAWLGRGYAPGNEAGGTVRGNGLLFYIRCTMDKRNKRLGH